MPLLLCAQTDAHEGVRVREGAREDVREVRAAGLGTRALPEELRCVAPHLRTP